MKCPDCNTIMEYITKSCVYVGNDLCEGYWKCPKCKIEIDDEEDQNDPKALELYAYDEDGKKVEPNV